MFLYIYMCANEHMFYITAMKKPLSHSLPVYSTLLHEINVFFSYKQTCGLLKCIISIYLFFIIFRSLMKFKKTRQGKSFSVTFKVLTAKQENHNGFTQLNFQGFSNKHFCFIYKISHVIKWQYKGVSLCLSQLLILKYISYIYFTQLSICGIKLFYRDFTARQVAK